MKRLLVPLVSAALCIFFYPPQAIKAQPGAPETSPVGVIPEGEEAAGPARTTLKLVGSDCDLNEAEASLLRLKGVVGVDVESMKDYLVVDYLPGVVVPQQMVDTVRARMDGTDAIGRHMGGEKAKRRGCFAQIPPAGGAH